MRLRHALAIALLAGAGSAAAQDLNRITAVEVKDEGKTVSLSVTGSKPPNFTTFSMADPPRFVLDLSEARFQGVPEDMPVNDGTILVVKNLSYGADATSIARIMMAFSVDVDPPDVQVQGGTLVVRVVKPAGAAVAKGPSAEDLEAQRRAEADAAARAEAKVRAEAEAQARAEAEVKAEAARAAARAQAQVPAPAPAVAAAAPAGGTSGDTAALLVGAQVEPEKKVDEAAAREQAQEAAKLSQDEQDRAAAAAAAAAAAEDEKARAKAEAVRAREEALAAAKTEQERKKLEAAEKKAAAQREREERLAAARVEKEHQRQEALEKKAAAQRERAERLAAAKAEQDRKRQERLEALAAARTEKDRKRQEAAEARAEAGRQRAEAVATARHAAQLRELGFRQLPGVSRVFLRTSSPPRFTIQDVGENLIRVELENTKVVRRNDVRFLDTSFFSSAVALITPSRRGTTYVVDIKLKQKVPYQQKVEGDMLAIDFERPGAPASAGAPAPGVEPDAPAEEAAAAPGAEVPAALEAPPAPEPAAQEPRPASGGRAR